MLVNKMLDFFCFACQLVPPENEDSFIYYLFIYYKKNYIYIFFFWLFIYLLLFFFIIIIIIFFFFFFGGGRWRGSAQNFSGPLQKSKPPPLSPLPPHWRNSTYASDHLKQIYVCWKHCLLLNVSLPLQMSKG